MLTLLHPITGAVRAVRRSTPVGTLSTESPSSPLSRIVRPEAALRWRSTTTSWWTPQMVETTLRGAFAGDLQSQWELFDLMEDTWPRLAKDLAEVKRAVCSRKWKVEPWEEEEEAPSDEAKARASLVSNAVWTCRPNVAADERDFPGVIFDLLDAWGKGLSVAEILWEQRDAGKLGQIIAPRGFAWVGPNNYGVDKDGVLKLRAGNSQSSIFNSQSTFTDFPEHKFLLGICKARTAHFTGAALLRPLAWWWAASNFSADWLLNLAQIFGLPIRWASYDPNASDAQVAKICDMLENMGSAGWAAFPAGTQLELKEPSKSGENYPQSAILDRADAQCDLLILGQTGTSEIGGAGKSAGGSFAATKVHASVRDEIIEAATEWVENVLNGQLIPAILTLNFGDTSEAPEFCGEPDVEEDRKALADRDAVLMDRGVGMPKKWFYARHDIPLPQPDEEVITKPAPQPAPGLPLPAGEGRGEGEQPPAQNDPPVTARNATDQLIDRALENLSGVQAKWLGGVRPHFQSLMAKAADLNGVSDEEFIAAVEKFQRDMPELFRKLQPQHLENALYDAMSAGVLNGALQGHMKRAKAAKEAKP
jgi:phage gp29-like protein